MTGYWGLDNGADGVLDKLLDYILRLQYNWNGQRQHGTQIFE